MQETKTCQNKEFSKYCEGEFTIVSEDFQFYEKMKVPPPTFCPTCRMQRRFAFRNQNKLFRNTSAFSNKEILALIPKDSGIKVVTQEEWFSDTWDAMDYGVDIDFSKPFLQQLLELHRKIPQYNLNVTQMVNSPFSAGATQLKNCYLLFGSNYSEDCAYGNAINFSKYCIDNSYIEKSEFSYESLWIYNSSKTYYSEECTECSEIWFSKNCIGCMNCIGCVNLRNKSYCIENVQYTRDEYFKKLEEFSFKKYTNVTNYKNYIFSFWKKFPKKFSQGSRNQNSTGVYITNSKNVNNSFLIYKGEDIKYSQFIAVPPSKDIYDHTAWGDGIEMSYENSVCGLGIHNIKFCFNCWPNIRDTEYSLHSKSSHDIFGCVGVRNKSYCILNKQYTKEEYENLIPQIKKHMMDMPYIDKQGRIYKYGEFFPIEFSWYGYNNTTAQEVLPLNSNEATHNGYAWYEIPQGIYESTILSENLPDDITEANNTILDQIIQCNNCVRKYKITQQELDFLQREKLPLPRKCPDCRYEDRISRRLKPKLYKMKCMKDGCENEFETGYNPQDGNIVYCEKCYQQEVI